MTPSEILAKSQPQQTLVGHLRQVREAGAALLTPARLAAFARVGINSQRAQALVASATWLHDWGKATAEWQAALRANQSTPQHSLTGFLAALWAFNVDKVETMPPDLLAVALAVLGHHGQLSDASFRPDVFVKEQVTIPWNVWEELKHDLPLQGPASAKMPAIILAQRVCSKVAHAKERCHDFTAASHFRGLYCLLLTLLIQADHAASGGVQPHPVSIGPPHVAGDLTEFQRRVPPHPSKVLCGIAGCGSGKTAAALLRAADYVAHLQVDRIVICLPTRFTSNSLLRDMSDANKYAYPKELVGLVHSEALQVLRASVADEEDFFGSPEEIASQSVRYELPITVSTVDHLLMSLYHGYRYADRAFGNLLSSLVVFDEIHAYDTTTLSAIYEGLQILQKYSIPTLFLSATLPSSRRQFLGLTAEQTVIEQDNPYRPFFLRRLEMPLTTGRGTQLEVSTEVCNFLRDAAGLKVAVYVNQVERAKALAKAARSALPDSPVYCYHSELAPRDRQELERIVIEAFRKDHPVVLVATQAAELSLDISTERMITELAPVDTLIQRGGRLHRRGLRPYSVMQELRLPEGFEYCLYVAPLDLTINEQGLCAAALPYDDPAVLSASWDEAPWDQEFMFTSGVDWCERVLKDVPTRISVGLAAAAGYDAAFGKRPQENYTDEKNPNAVTIRDIDSNTVLVLPEASLGTLPNTMTELSQYLVPVRQRKFHMIDKGLVEKRTHKIRIGFGSKTKEINYELYIIKSHLPYDTTGGGFDFSLTASVLEPTVSIDIFY